MNDENSDDRTLEFVRMVWPLHTAPDGDAGDAGQLFTEADLFSVHTMARRLDMPWWVPGLLARALQAHEQARHTERTHGDLIARLMGAAGFTDDEVRIRRGSPGVTVRSAVSLHRGRVWLQGITAGPGAPGLNVVGVRTGDRVVRMHSNNLPQSGKTGSTLRIPSHEIKLGERVTATVRGHDACVSLGAVVLVQLVRADPPRSMGEV